MVVVVVDVVTNMKHKVLNETKSRRPLLVLVEVVAKNKTYILKINYNKT